MPFAPLHLFIDFHNPYRCYLSGFIRLATIGNIGLNEFQSLAKNRRPYINISFWLILLRILGEPIISGRNFEVEEEHHIRYSKLIHHLKNSWWLFLVSATNLWFQIICLARNSSRRFFIISQSSFLEILRGYYDLIRINNLIC